MALYEVDEKVSGAVWDSSSGDLDLKTVEQDEKKTIQRIQRIISSVELLCGGFDIDTADFIKVKNPKAQTIDSSVESYSLEYVAQQVIELDKFGREIKNGFTCPVCGKHVKYIPNLGFCSIECYMKRVLQNVMDEWSQLDYETSKLIKKIDKIVSMANIAINLLLDLPRTIQDLAHIPEIYRNYLLVELDIQFNKLQIVINNLIIKKNEYLIKILEKIKLGTINKALEVINVLIEAIMKTISLVQTTFNTVYATVYEMLTTVSRMFTLEPEGMAFFMTKASAMNPLFIGQPLVKLQAEIISPFNSLVNNANVEQINLFVQNTLPPILPIEYFLDPDAFKLRLILSDQNRQFMTDLLYTLNNLLVLNGDFLPRYSKLSLINPWFVCALIFPTNQFNLGNLSRRIFGVSTLFPIV